MFIVTEYAALHNAYTATKIIIMYPVGPDGFYLVCAFVNLTHGVYMYASSEGSGRSIRKRSLV